MTISLILPEQFPQVTFGTSGIRALVSDLTPQAVSAYVFAFMQRMRDTHAIANGATIAIGMDLRPSSPHIAATVCGTLTDLGYQSVFLGTVPTPALALHCLSVNVPGIMITGSHIPFDRNGIKFYSPSGEILKEDEQAIFDCPIPSQWLETLVTSPTLPPPNVSALQHYAQRYIAHFGQCLQGWRIGVYEHSAAGRDLTKTILEGLGATVIALGRSDDFIPIDTEAVNESDLHQAILWCNEHHLDALVSTDGDGDRPLVFDEKGQFIRGDILGLLCAKQLGLTVLAIPVSCNTAIEKTQLFKQIIRTRIGSPYVIAAMNDLQCPTEAIGGFEANGGFLLGSDLPTLSALPTRDALLPIVAALSSAAAKNITLSTIVETLPSRYMHSDRIQNISTIYSRALLDRLLSDTPYLKILFSEKDDVVEINTIDGVRLTFIDGDIVHIRPSGNAPELRCYAEASNFDTAKKLCITTLSRIKEQYQ